jgi:hypothetical protein
MIRASKVTTGIASLVIMVGLAATVALPFVPKPPARERAPRDAGTTGRGRRRTS